MDTSIGIKKDKLTEIGYALSKLLADEFLLSTKTRNAHWNVEGIDFSAKHLFFDGQYKQLDELVDSVAERIRTLGEYAPATLGQFLELTHLTEQARIKNNSSGYIRELLEDHEAIIIYVRQQIAQAKGEFLDFGTADFMTTLLESHEKMAWMLRAHLVHAAALSE